MEHIIVRESFNETTTKYNISGKMVAITEKEIQRKLKAPMDAKHPSDPGYPACPDCGGKITRDEYHMMAEAYENAKNAVQYFAIYCIPKREFLIFVRVGLVNKSNSSHPGLPARRDSTYLSNALRTLVSAGLAES